MTINDLIILFTLYFLVVGLIHLLILKIKNRRARSNRNQR